MAELFENSVCYHHNIAENSWFSLIWPLNTCLWFPEGFYLVLTKNSSTSFITAAINFLLFFLPVYIGLFPDEEKVHCTNKKCPSYLTLKKPYRICRTILLLHEGKLENTHFWASGKGETRFQKLQQNWHCLVPFSVFIFFQIKPSLIKKLDRTF